MPKNVSGAKKRPRVRIPGPKDDTEGRLRGRDFFPRYIFRPAVIFFPETVVTMRSQQSEHDDSLEFVSK